jgi:hypothetical protein
MAEAYSATAKSSSTAEVTAATPTVAATSTAKSSPTTAAAVSGRPVGRTEHKQRGANYAKYSFCFHNLTLARAACRYHCEPVRFCDASLE